jgi:hypothetical protein
MTLDKPLCCPSRRRGIATVAVNKDQRDRAFRQKDDFTGKVTWLNNAGSRQELREMSFELGLMTSRDNARGMSGEID